MMSIFSQSMLNRTATWDPNNTLENENTVPLNEAVHTSIVQEGDAGYFTFTLDRDTVIWPKYMFMSVSNLFHHT